MQPIQMLRGGRTASWTRKQLVFAGVALLCAAAPGLRAQSNLPTANAEDSFHLFPLSAATSGYEANDIQTALRNMTPRAKVYYVPSEGAFVVRANPTDMQLIETIIADLDKPRAMYRLTYTLAETGADGQTKTEHETVMLAAHGETVLRQGVRVPLVTGTSSKGDQGSEVQYIDLGLRIEASLEGLGQGLRLHTKVERSSIADQKSTVPPDPEIRQVTLDERSPIMEGKSFSIGTLDLSDGKIEISVKADSIP